MTGVSRKIHSDSAAAFKVFHLKQKIISLAGPTAGNRFATWTLLNVILPEINRVGKKRLSVLRLCKEDNRIPSE